MLSYLKMGKEKADTTGPVERYAKIGSGGCTKNRKYLIVVRHGERIDETDPDKVKGNEDEYYDTGLTDQGKINSRKTGYRLMKIFRLLDSLDSGLKTKFISSVFYRCLQTSECIRDGMHEYLQNKGHLLKDPATRAHELSARHTNLEEACSEKIKMLPVEYIDNLRIIKREKETLEEFAGINPSLGTLFDYQNKHKDLGLKVLFHKSDHVIQTCYRFYKKIIKRLKYDQEHDKYVIVAHGMYLNILSWLLQLKDMKKVKYNSCTVIEFDFCQDHHKEGEEIAPFRLVLDRDLIHD